MLRRPSCTIAHVGLSIDKNCRRFLIIADTPDDDLDENKLLGDDDGEDGDDGEERIKEEPYGDQNALDDDAIVTSIKEEPCGGQSALEDAAIDAPMKEEPSGDQSALEDDAIDTSMTEEPYGNQSALEDDLIDTSIKEELYGDKSARDNDLIDASRTGQNDNIEDEQTSSTVVDKIIEAEEVTVGQEETGNGSLEEHLTEVTSAETGEHQGAIDDSADILAAVDESAIDKLTADFDTELKDEKESVQPDVGEENLLTAVVKQEKCGLYFDFVLALFLPSD